MSDIPINELKILIAAAGGRCAFPGCGKLLLTQSPQGADPIFSGEACHIVARSRQGPRGKSDRDEDERNHHTNLILLCPEHHTLIDKRPMVYSVRVLLTIKATHEAKHGKDQSVKSSTIEIKSERVQSTCMAVTQFPGQIFISDNGGVWEFGADFLQKRRVKVVEVLVGDNDIIQAGQRRQPQQAAFVRIVARVNQNSLLGRFHQQTGVDKLGDFHALSPTGFKGRNRGSGQGDGNNYGDCDRQDMAFAGTGGSFIIFFLRLRKRQLFLVRLGRLLADFAVDVGEDFVQVAVGVLRRGRSGVYRIRAAGLLLYRDIANHLGFHLVVGRR